jgi:hypothetical protein
LLATLRKPPPRGSAQSYVLQALLIRKDQIEYLRTFALVQAIVSKEDANKALETYRDAQMPYLPKVQRVDRQKHIERLMAEVAKGPVKIVQVMQKPARSKLRARVIQRTQEEKAASDRRLAAKLGGHL